MSTAAAPYEIGTVHLTVQDLPRVADFYARALGMHKLGGDGTETRLGAGDRPLLTLTGDRHARKSSPREAGLFHTAFLLPARADLGAWVHHASESRLPVQGASDHHVSEAIYLADPEGNGIEIYTDRPRATWTNPDGSIRMGTDPLDIPDLAAAARAPWTGAPAGTVVGHIHLQVGNVAEAEAFYGGELGFATMAHYPGAAFLASGGYHHHIGANVWNSRGAGRRSPGTGLSGFTILADMLPAQTRTTDPWGIDITFQPKG